jgi:hypothetical protein
LRILLLAAAIMACASGAAAQSTLRFELGFGGGVGGVDSGGALRLGTGVSVGPWGGLLRFSGHAGKRLGSVFGFPVEEFIGEVGVLASYGLVPTAPHRLLVGAGFGFARGDRVDPGDSQRLVEIPDAWGVPFEMTWHLGDGRGLGGSLSAQGHLNREASFVALLLSLTLGLGL